MAGLLGDDEFGGNAGLGGIAAGMEGFLKGLQGMREYNLRKDEMDESRRFREMEMTSKLKAQDEARERQRTEDAYKQKKDDEERLVRDAKMTLEGNQSGYKYDPVTKSYVFDNDLWKRALEMRQAQAVAAASADPYGVKGMQAEKLSREQKQAMEGFKLPPDKVLQVQQGSQIPNQLKDLSSVIDSNKDLFGPVAGRAGAANPYDTQAQTIDAQMRASSQAFGRYMEGGVLRKEDEDKYRKMFPQLTDTPEVARNKLAVVNRLLTQKQNADVSALRDQGYDVRAFGLLPEGKMPEGLIKQNSQELLPDQGRIPVITPKTTLGGLSPEKEARRQELLRKAQQGNRVANGVK